MIKSRSIIWVGHADMKNAYKNFSLKNSREETTWKTNTGIGGWEMVLNES
jgi:hypothetical protein